MNNKIKVLDLFSGIGGFSLGLERTGGFETVAFCEINPYCKKILKKHWPHVPVFSDIRNLTSKELGKIDMITGGFPCQDISGANTKGEGLHGSKSSLWFEYKRLIEEIKPGWVIVENVSNLKSKGLATILQNFDELGYDVCWHNIPASAVGRPHKRERLFIVAYSKRFRLAKRTDTKHQTDPSNISGHSGKPSQDVAYSASEGLEGSIGRTPERCGPSLKGQLIPDGAVDGDYSRAIKSTIFRVANGISQRLDRRMDIEATPEDLPKLIIGLKNRKERIHALGNSIVPQIVTVIGEEILTTLNTSQTFK